MRSDLSTRTFEFEFKHDPTVIALTEIFVPNHQYPDHYEVELSDGSNQVNRQTQTLIVYHTSDREVHTVRITPVG